MVDRLNPAPPLPLPGSAHPGLDGGRADFGKLLGAASPNGQSPAQNKDGRAQAGPSDAASALIAMKLPVDGYSQDPLAGPPENLAGMALVDLAQGGAAVPAPANVYDRLPPALDQGVPLVLDLPGAPGGVPVSPQIGGASDSTPAAGFSVQLLQSPVDADAQDGLLVEYENALPAIADAASKTPDAGERTTLVVKLNSPQSGQRDELVAMPWHLLAGDHLSQMIAGGRRIVLPGAVNRSQAQSPAGPVAAAGVASVGVPSPALASAQLRELSPAGQASVPAEPSSLQAEAEAGVPSRLGQSGAFVAWPLRLLRWLADGNQEVTAWLRDYNLSDSAAEAVVRQLRTLSDEQGVRLNRIVFNGHQLWRANDPKYFS